MAFNPLSLMRIGAAALLVLALILVPFLLFGARFEDAAARLPGAGSGAIALAGGLLLALDAVLPVPSSVVATTMGAALGAWAGTAVNAVGLTAGCAVGLALGRAGSPIAGKILGDRLYPGFREWVARYGIAAVLLCRAVPVLAEASAITLGAGRARPMRIIATAAAADLLLGAAYAFAGAAEGPAAAPAAPALAAAIGIPAAAAIVVLLWIRTRSASPAR